MPAQHGADRIRIPLARLPQAFDGLTIAVVADLHASPLRGGIAAAQRVVDAVAASQPNVIVLLGDMVHQARDAPALLAPLAQSRASHGVYVCLGNHEHGFIWYSRYVGPSATFSTQEWRRLYADLGVELLVNEARPLTRGDARIWIVGVDDAYSGHHDLAAALREVADGECRIAITHSPDLLDDPRAQEVDLILAGHTHGGQIHIPPLGPIWAPCRKPRERTSGLIRNQATVAYVSRGVGEGLPIRIGCPRELPVIELRSQGAGTRTPVNEPQVGEPEGSVGSG